MAERALVVSVPAVVVVAVAWSSGGYFPRSWGALLLFEAIALAAAAILATRVDLGLRPFLVVGGLLALAAWALASRAWSVAPDAAVLEAERTLVYAGAAAAAFLAVSRARAADLVLAVLLGAGTTVAGGLVEHTVGSGVPGERLEAPVGYANAAGILAAVTLVLGLGLAADGPAWRRAFAAGSAPPAAAALYLSLSRGSVLAAALGVALLFLTARRAPSPARMILAALPALAALVVASRLGSFGEPGADGREVLSLLALAALAALAAALAWSPPRVPLPSVSRRTAVVACGAVAAIVGVALVAAGVREVRQIRSTPAAQQGAPDRLLSASTSSRSEYWQVAAGMVESAPLLGEGAGGFERVWLRERPALLFVRDAHNLYLEALAELGPVGLAALLLALLTPLAGARAAARDPAGPAALAAYAALLAHSLLDWDWELPAVTLCTLFLGVALVRLGEPVRPRPPAPAARAALGVGAAVTAAVALLAHVGNGATADASDALDRGDPATALHEAERARRFAPWAAEPWQLLGEAELAAGRLAPALRHLRRATREDPASWSAWLSLATVAEGAERARALARARAANPLAPEIEAVEAALEDPSFG